MARLAIISSQAFSLINFRDPLIRALADAGVAVDALAPDYDEDVQADGAVAGLIITRSGTRAASRSGQSPSGVN
ncbi:hypothetical protein CDA09_18365 [Azoarcus sp. DN11]|nr:hypothetical protein CDA09_18365 [Azoarcus sp. DN11]